MRSCRPSLSSTWQRCAPPAHCIAHFVLPKLATGGVPRPPLGLHRWCCSLLTRPSRWSSSSRHAMACLKPSHARPLLTAC